MEDDMTDATALAGVTPSAVVTRRDRAFLGHPVGLGWLSASEFWERFAYYGTASILGLFLANHLLQPGNTDGVIGFPVLQDVVVWITKLLKGSAPTSDGFAAAIASAYSGLVYLTPIVGGLLADRVLGRTLTVSLGAILMAAGYFMLAFDSLFVVAIALLLLGVGCFKGNIAAQVGDLYSHDDPRRADGFQIYFMGIQFSAILTPFICGTLGERVGWAYGFGAAGIGMLIGMVIYLFGVRTYPKETKAKTAADRAEARPRLTGRDWLTFALLIFLLPVLALGVIGNQEIFATYLIWGEKGFQTTLYGMTMPISWLISVDAFISAFLMAGVIAFWRWYSKRRTEPTELTKMIIGTAISSLAPLMLAGAAASTEATGQPASLWWAIAFHVINDLGFANVLPVGLALYSRAAPKGFGGMMISLDYVHLFITGTVLIVGLSAYYGTISNTNFWLIHVALMLVGLVILIATRLLFGHLLAPAFEKAKPA